MWLAGVGNPSPAAIATTWEHLKKEDPASMHHKYRVQKIAESPNAPEAVKEEAMARLKALSGGPAR